MNKYNVVHIHNEVLFSHQKNEILLSAAAWTKFGKIVLINQLQKNAICSHLLIEVKICFESIGKHHYEVNMGHEGETERQWLVCRRLQLVKGIASNVLSHSCSTANHN